MDETEAREQLARAMEKRRIELRLQWTDVARRARMSPQNLLRIRHGTISITWKAADAIEHALEWTSGSVEAILTGGDPAPQHASRADGEPIEADGDNVWTEELEAIYQALTELLRPQGLKPTPEIIQAMREQWELDRARDAEGDVSDQAG